MNKKNIVLLSGIILIIVVLFIVNKNNGDNQVELNNETLVISEVIPKNLSLYMDSKGDYYDLIEIYNPSKNDIDLQGMGLSDDPKEPLLWTFKSGTIKAGEYLIVFAAGSQEEENEGYYTNFKLKAEGESVSLANQDGHIISQLSYVDLSEDMSLSLIDGDYVVIYKGTPGEANSGLVVNDSHEYNQELDFSPSHLSGIYDKPITLTFQQIEGYELRYTLDSSNPTEQSLIYNSNILLDDSNLNKTLIANIQSTFYSVDRIPDQYINKGTVVKARYFKNNVPIGNTYVGTYFVWNKKSAHNFDIVSLTTDPENLFDPNTGIHVVGDKYEKEAPKNPDGGTPANYNQRGIEWEREANVEFFSNTGDKLYETGVGIRMFGGWSRANTKKSFKLFAKTEYGDKTFDYPFFENLVDEKGETIDSFERLLLRTGGNDGEYALFRDPLADSLIDGMLDYQQYKPVVLYLNGEYWGIYHLREHMDENYIGSHYNVDPNEVNILAYNSIGIESYAGDEDELKRFEEFVAYVEDNDLSETSNYDYVKERLDIDNFINYYITQMFINNVDWPSNNAKVWSYVGDDDSLTISDGKYRYLLYDTEFSFGLYSGASASSHNYFEFLHQDTSNEWPNPAWSTVLYRNFIKNEEFQAAFILRLTDLLNSRFDKELVLNRIDEMKDLYLPEMEDYLNRWNFWAVPTVRSWEVDQLNVLKEFTEKRGGYLLDDAKKQYDLDVIRNVNVESFEGGSIIVNSNYQLRFDDIKAKTLNDHDFLFTLVKKESQTLKYFGDYSIKLQVSLDEGYRFVAWDIVSNSQSIISGDLSSEDIELQLDDDMTIKPIIEKVAD